MSSRFDDPRARAEVLERLRGKGERSTRKSYYPALQARITELERFRTLLDESGEAIFLLDWPSARIVDATGTATRQLGLARDQLIGTPWSTLLDPAAAGGFAEAAGRAAPEGPQLILQAGLRAAGGRLFPAELGLRQVRQAGQDFLVVVARDVTEREQMRGRLAVADRMVSIGTLAAGVAHEINNPLAYVLGNLDHVRRELGRLRRDAAAGSGLPARVVFVTGGAFTERTEAFLRSTTAPSLEKPFSQAALQAAIEMVRGR